MTKALAFLAVVSLLVVAPATATHRDVSGSAQVTRTTSGYALTVRNTGSEAIRCVLVLLPTGTTMGAAGSAAGWQLTVTITLALVAYSLPGTLAAPGAGLAPGAAVVLPFTATGDAIGASPSAQGMIVRINPTNCVFTTSTPTIASISGPASPPPATSTGSTAPCRCTSLGATVTRVTLVKPAAVSAAEALFLKLQLTWSMSCTAGDGGCSGALSVHGTVPETHAGLLIDDRPNYNASMGTKFFDIKCAGPCTQPLSGIATFYAAGNGTYNAAALGTKIKRLTLLVYRTCNGAKTPLTISLVFGTTSTGGPMIDYTKSDLNGDRKPDG